MPRSEAQKRADRKYFAKTYYKLPIRFKRTEYDALREAIAKSGESFNGFVIRAIYDRLSALNITVDFEKKEP